MFRLDARCGQRRRSIIRLLCATTSPYPDSAGDAATVSALRWEIHQNWRLFNDRQADLSDSGWRKRRVAVQGLPYGAANLPFVRAH